MAGNLIKVILVSFRTDNVNHLMERHLRVLLRVGRQVFAENAVVRDLVVAYRWKLGSKHVCESLLDGLGNDLLTLVSFALENLLIKVVLNCLFDVFAEGRLAHAR